VRFTPAAQSDIEDILRAIAEHDPSAAQQVDFHEVDAAQQQALPLALVDVPAFRSRALVAWRKHLNTCHQPMLSGRFIDFDYFDKRLPMFLLDKSPHDRRLGSAPALRDCGAAASLSALLSVPWSAHANIRYESVGAYVLFLDDFQIRSFTSSHHISLGHRIGKPLRNTLNEMAVEIAPQPACLDKGIHAWKWRLHQ